MADYSDFSKVFEGEKIKTAVIGATGAVGQIFMWMLADHPWFEISYITASSTRVGKTYGDEVQWKVPYPIPGALLNIDLKDFDIPAMKDSGVRIVFSAMPADVARVAEPLLREAGFYVFSNAGAMRNHEDVPILIPEANYDSLSMIEGQGYPEGGFVVTNANCSTTGLAVALAPLRKFGIDEVTVSTYQSISGAGYPGLSAFDINGNVVPFIGGEEEKMISELKKILTINPEIFPFCVRIPVMFGHLETVWVKFREKTTPDEIRQVWENFVLGGEELPSTPERPIVYLPQRDFPQARHSFFGKPQGMVVYTGRLKQQGDKIGFTLLVNNLVKGAAGGSIQNAEAFVVKYLQ